MDVPPDIPSWGKLKERFVEASVRVPRNMETLIDEGKMLGAVNLLKEASKDFGVADDHQYAANVIIPVDKKDALIENAEKLVGIFASV